MKKSSITNNDSKPGRLSFRPETIRILTERELTLVVAGNCVKGSVVSQATTSTLVGTC
jgi:hypothetical protein